MLISLSGKVASSATPTLSLVERVIACREELQPVTRHFLTRAAEENTAIGGEILADIEGIAGRDGSGKIGQCDKSLENWDYSDHHGW